MVRTQVQFTESQIKALRKASAATGKSIADLVRQGVDLYFTAQHAIPQTERIERAIRVAGRFSSGHSDVSTAHDRHLTEAYRQ